MIALKVAAIKRVTPAVVEVELRDALGSDLPPFSAGAHIAVHLPNDIVRSYSLTNDQRERDRYIIAVGRDSNSRGGSSFIHDVLEPSHQVKAEPPRNNFPFAEKAKHNVFFAGGIGITPYLSMIRRARELDCSWELYYSARSRSNGAFLNELEQLQQEGSRLVTHFDDEMNGQFIDLGKIVEQSDQDSDFYCCGPAPMLAAFKEATKGCPPERVHFELFSNLNEADTTGGFTVHLSRQNRSVFVAPGQTILTALLEAGIDAPASCREGVCGTCEVRVLEGKPFHRDSVLSEAERESNETMMICCSGSLTPDLTIDM
jgi:ferredoxin-NADP reductase